MWKFETKDSVLGGMSLVATATPELYDALSKQIQELSEKLMYEEERLVLTNLPDSALVRLETIVSKEINRRRDVRLLGNIP